MGNPFSVTSCVLGKVARGAELFPGCRVLARREVDGFYYLGTIVHQLQVKQKFEKFSIPLSVMCDHNINIFFTLGQGRTLYGDI